MDTRPEAALWIARHLPRWLVYTCGVVLWSEATSGEYGKTDATSITMAEVLQRWQRKR